MVKESERAQDHQKTINSLAQAYRSINLWQLCVKIQPLLRSGAAFIQKSLMKALLFSIFIILFNNSLAYFARFYYPVYFTRAEKPVYAHGIMPTSKCSTFVWRVINLDCERDGERWVYYRLENKWYFLIND